MFELVAHGPDTFVGSGPKYPWGGLYGGQIVAQALRAAAQSVDPVYAPHSIRAYFIRPGDHNEPVRYEVDRTRNGRSFVTRRVIARQAIGAILNAECSFHRPEESVTIQTVTMPDVAAPTSIQNTSFSSHFDRRFVPDDAIGGASRDGAGRVAAWFRVTDDLPDIDDAPSPFLHQAWLAYMSDDLATDTVRATYRQVVGEVDGDELFGVSLDHTIWFHRPMRADRWHLQDFSCHHFVGARGLAVGHVFDDAGEHTLTVAQEVLVRQARDQPGSSN